MHASAQPSRSSASPVPAQGELGVVVGFDGSHNAEVALAHGAAIAARRERPLTVITSYRPTIPGYPTIEGQQEDPEDAARRQKAEAVLEGAAALLTAHPGPVSCLAVEGDSVGTLVDASSRADVLVIGTRGRGGFLGLVMGSVSTTLPAYAHCPTVVVPASSELGDGPVVAGVDGSPHARRAALCAAQEAVSRGVPLVLVTATPTPDGGELHDIQQEEVARVATQVPGVEVSGEVRTGAAAAVLHEAAREAALVVVGSHGRGRFVSALMGSVSRAVLHGAHRPVMVVPTHAEDEAGQADVGR